MYASLTSFTRHTHSSLNGLYITSHVSGSLRGSTNGIEVSIGHCTALCTSVCNAHMTCHMMRTQVASFPLPRH